jgi:hypothetical protein
VARPAATLDQAVAIENRMDGALGRYSDIAAEPPDQELANLTRAPVRLLGLQPESLTPPRPATSLQADDVREFGKITLTDAKIHKSVGGSWVTSSPNPDLEG